MQIIQHNLWNGNDKSASIFEEITDNGDEYGS